MRVACTHSHTHPPHTPRDWMLGSSDKTGFCQDDQSPIGGYLTDPRLSNAMFKAISIAGTHNLTTGPCAAAMERKSGLPGPGVLARRHGAIRKNCLLVDCSGFHRQPPPEDPYNLQNPDCLRSVLTHFDEAVGFFHGYSDRDSTVVVVVGVRLCLPHLSEDTAKLWNGGCVCVCVCVCVFLPRGL